MDYRWAQPFLATLSNWFWASSPYVGHSSYAWYVVFNDGNVGSGGSRNGSLHVRLVRASQ